MEGRVDHQTYRSSKRVSGFGARRSREAQDADLEVIAEQLEILSKIDWSRYRIT